MTFYLLTAVIISSALLSTSISSSTPPPAVCLINEHSCTAANQQDTCCYRSSDDGRRSKLIVLFQCLCDEKTSGLERLHEALEKVNNAQVGVVLFTALGETIEYNYHVNQKRGCDVLCEKATPTNETSRDDNYSSFETLLKITAETLESEKKWVESSPTNELHIIGIRGAKSTVSHVTSYPKEHYHPLIISILNSCIKEQTTFHYLVHSTAAAGAMRLMGDLSSSVIYSDGTHFNKALTLARLISTGLAETVQAHCLSQGLNWRVSQYTESLESIGYSSLLWDPFPLNVQYQNRCLSVNETCLYYCSPLHGCVQEKHSFDSEVKPRLSSVEFKTSHAEYYTSLWQTQEQSQEQWSQKLSILQPPSANAPHFTLDDVVTDQPKTAQWSSYTDLITGDQPVLLKSTQTAKWPALKLWNMSYLADNMDSSMSFVKCSDNYLTFDPDAKSPLKLNLSLPYKVKNMTSDLFFNCVQDQCSDPFKGHYYFGEVPQKLKPDVKPNSFLYNTEEDREADRQYMWISSAGMITHGHFDQDYNLFVQLVGEKRFTLWSPSQHELLYMFPRVHPLWHKSRVNFREIDLNLFPGFSRSRAVQVTVGPGDILFIPPYTWHYVETLSPSVSLSTWSHDYHMYRHMNAIYGHDHKFDLITSSRGQMFALRLYLDMLVQELYGFNETTRFFARFLSTRFTGLENLFPPEENDPLLCQANEPGRIPLCYHVHGYVKLDVEVVGGHFKALRPEVMDILMADYIEEISAQVIGVNKLLAFFRYCFQGQSYYITSPDEPEHSMWDYLEL